MATNEKKETKSKLLRNLGLAVGVGILGGMTLAALRGRSIKQPRPSSSSPVPRPSAPTSPFAGYAPSADGPSLMGRVSYDKAAQALNAADIEEAEEAFKSLTSNKAVEETTRSLPSNLGLQALPPGKPALAYASPKLASTPYLGIYRTRDVREQLVRANDAIKRSVGYGILENDIAARLGNARETVASIGQSLKQVDLEGSGGVLELGRLEQSRLRDLVAGKLLLAGDNTVSAGNLGRLTFDTDPEKLYDVVSAESFINDYLLKNSSKSIDDAAEVYASLVSSNQRGRSQLLQDFRNILARSRRAALGSQLNADVALANKSSGPIRQSPPNLIVPSYPQPSARTVDTSTLFARIKDSLGNRLREVIASQPRSIQESLRRIDQLPQDEADAVISQVAQAINPRSIVGDLETFEPVVSGNSAAAYKLAAKHINNRYIESLSRKYPELANTPYAALRRIIDRGIRDELYAISRIAQSRMDRELFPVPIKVLGADAVSEKVGLIGFSAVPDTSRPKRMVL